MAAQGGPDPLASYATEGGEVMERQGMGREGREENGGERRGMARLRGESYFPALRGDGRPWS